MTPAANGGFAIYERYGPGYESVLLYAGTLAACTGFLTRHFTPPKKPKRS